MRSGSSRRTGSSVVRAALALSGRILASASRLARNHPAMATVLSAFTLLLAVVAYAFPRGPAERAPAAAPTAAASAATPTAAASGATGGLDVHAQAEPFDTRSPYPGGSTSFLFAKPPTALSRPPSTLDLQNDPAAAVEWGHANGGVHADTTYVSVVVTGRSQDVVVVTGFRVKVLERRAPMKAYLVDVTAHPAGGAIDERILIVDLDRPTTKIEMVDEEGKKPWSFPLTVSSTEPEYFFITANATACDCVWVAELDYVLRGERHTYRVDRDGAPFRTSSAIAALAHYQTPDGINYTWCGVKRQTDLC